MTYLLTATSVTVGQVSAKLLDLQFSIAVSSVSATLYAGMLDLLSLTRMILLEVNVYP